MIKENEEELKVDNEEWRREDRNAEPTGAHNVFSKVIFTYLH